MDCNEESDSDYLVMVELSTEIGTLVQRTIDKGHNELTPSDVEHILKVTSDVTLRIKPKSQELTV